MPLTCTKLNSKLIKDLNIKPGTLDLTEEKVGNTLETIGTEEDFLNRAPLMQVLRSTFNKWDLMKLRNFCMAKDTVIWTK